MGRWRLGVGLVVAAMLLATAGTAQAQLRRGGEFEAQPAYASGLVRLGKSDGYRGYLFMATNGVALLAVEKVERTGKDLGTLSVVRYVVHTRGSLASGTVRGRFGSLGSFSLRFRPNGQVREEEVEDGCEGPAPVLEHGRFIGHLTFHGEHHYLHFSLSGGPGEISRSFELICEKGKAFHLSRGRLRPLVVPGSFFSTPDNIALLYASARRHGRFTGIVAGHPEGEPPGAELRFGSFESNGAMAIGRYALALTPRGTLLTSLPGEHPATATLKPPPPFYGEARYREKSAHAGTWSGNLGIDLAGLRLPLTGPGFHARLCVLNPLKTRSGCDFFKAEPEYDERPARPWWVTR